MTPRPPLADAPPAEVVAERLTAVRARIAAAGRDPDHVRVVAVTKGFGADAVAACVAAGVVDIGENYAPELLSKAAAAPAKCASQVSWHYLGVIQRRRVRALAPVVAWWETVARLVEGQAIASRAPGATVLVEVDVTGLPGRNGCAPDAVPDLVAGLRALALDVRGLMVVGPPGPAEGARAGFRATARLAHDLGLRELSMGMTQDLDIAVREGSTMVRVGRALFGERPVPFG